MTWSTGRLGVDDVGANGLAVDDAHPGYGVVVHVGCGQAHDPAIALVGARDRAWLSQIATVAVMFACC
jgi:hypothetical protein